MRQGMYYPATLKVDTYSGAKRVFDSVEGAKQFLCREGVPGHILIGYSTRI